jgi:hypothetical protein
MMASLTFYEGEPQYVTGYPLNNDAEIVFKPWREEACPGIKPGV